MLTSITLHCVATFNPEAAELNDLRKINYIFGSNGSGKTTISRVIADPSRWDSCSVSWTNGLVLPRHVYNRDFVEANFKPDADLKGVFTIGEDNLRLQEDIKAKTEQLAELDRQRESLDEAYAKKAKESGEIDETFRGACCETKNKFDEDFTPAFKGLNKSRKLFCDRILKEANENTAAAVSLDELVRRREALFDNDSVPRFELGLLDGSSLFECEENPILAQAIVASGDVPIRALIDRLQHGDWVQQGVTHLQASKPHCPFCQQKAPDDLELQLAGVFDQTYREGCKEVAACLVSYRKAKDLLSTQLSTILETSDTSLDVEDIRGFKDTLLERIRANIGQLEDKVRSPGKTVTLASTRDLVAAVNDQLTAFNADVRTHNARLDNLPAERKRLIDEMWRHVLDSDLKPIIADYKEQAKKCQTKINGIRTEQNKLSAAITECKEKLTELKGQTTSIYPTMEAINKMLKSLGFTTFWLREATEKPGCYQLVRRNGEPAAETLSDGERTFLTFLYFYHRIQGSHDPAAVTDDCIVVIDDPVSSIDSNVLFIVSHLIRNLAQRVKANTGSVKQLFVLTHNVYFHKEVTFNNRNKDRARSFESFWVVRRRDMQSTVERSETNPVKSSYELLWEEVRRPDPDQVTICNTLRRILEHYFKMLGGIDYRKLADAFDGQDKILCLSLFSWMHDGSHCVGEDAHLCPNSDAVDEYRRVFREVFVKQKQEGHYKMMMGEEVDDKEIEG